MHAGDECVGADCVGFLGQVRAFLLPPRSGVFGVLSVMRACAASFPGLRAYGEISSKCTSYEGMNNLSGRCKLSMRVKRPSSLVRKSCVYASSLTSF